MKPLIVFLVAVCVCVMQTSLVQTGVAPAEEFCSSCIDTNSDFCCRFFNICCLYVSPCPTPARPQSAICQKKKCIASSDCSKGQVCCHGAPCGPVCVTPSAHMRRALSIIL